MTHDTQQADSEEQHEDDESGTLLTRRDALTGAASILGVATLDALTSSGNAQSEGSFDAGGGEMADPAAEHRTRLYTGTLDERPDPNSPGRYWAATDAKVLYRDTGDQWVVEGGLGTESDPLPEQHVESLSTEDASTETLTYDYSQNYPQQPRQPEQSGPLTVRPHSGADNPVIEKADITDTTATLIGDPFMVYEDGLFYAFFEVYPEGGVPDVGYATSVDGLTWEYQTRVITDSQHRAYPLPLKVDGEWYMILDGYDNEGIPLFKATDFPETWEFQYYALSDSRVGGDFLDPATFKYNGKWWIFVTDSDTRHIHGYYNDEFPASDSEWTAHSQNPLYEGGEVERSGGRPLVTDDYVDLFFRDSTQSERRIQSERVSELSPDSFTSTRIGNSPIITPGSESWTVGGVGHFDPMVPTPNGPDIQLVQGQDADGNRSIGVFTTGSADVVPHDHQGDAIRPGSATIASLPSDRLLDSFSTEAISPDGTRTIDLSGVDFTNRHVIIQGTVTITSADTFGLEATLNGVASGYDYTAKSDGTAPSRVTGASSFQLVSTTNDNATMSFRYQLVQGQDYNNRDVVIHGDAVTSNTSREVLTEGSVSLGSDVEATSLEISQPGTEAGPAQGAEIDVIARKGGGV